MSFGCPGSRVGDVISSGDNSQTVQAASQNVPRSGTDGGRAFGAQNRPNPLRTTAGRIGRGTVNAMANARTQFASISGGLASRLSARLTRQGEPNPQPVGHQTNIAIQISVNPPNTPVDVNDQATPTSPSASPPNALQPDTLEALISQIMSEQLPGPSNASHQLSGLDSSTPHNQGSGDHAVPADVAPNHPLPLQAEVPHDPDALAQIFRQLANNKEHGLVGQRPQVNHQGIQAAAAARRQGPPQPLVLQPLTPDQNDPGESTPSVTPASSLRSVSVHNKGFFAGV